MLPRELTSQILAHFDSADLVFLLGTRQTGKTTLTHLVANDSSFLNDKIWYFDIEDKQYRALFNTATISSLKQILPLEGIDYKQRQLLIFDEIQLLDDPSNLLKLLHDHFPALKIIATGSSSLHLRKYLAINAGSQFNLSSARETIGISSATLSKYLNILEETFIIAELPPFLFLQNFNSLDLRRDAGALYETYVFNTLNWSKNITSSLYFYKSSGKKTPLSLAEGMNCHA